MGTQERRAREKDNVRQEILDAARDLFMREGYQATSIRKIAEKAEYATGTIYLHFRDKQEVLEALAAELFVRLDQRMLAIENDEVADPLEALRRGLRVYINFGLQHRNHYYLVFMIPPDQLARPLAEDKMRAGVQSFGHLVAIVQRCIALGKIAPADPMEVSQALWCGAHGVVSLLIAKCGFPFVEENRLIDRLLDTLIEGVRNKN